jgi:mono/diheme cytochrome c family protein
VRLAAALLCLPAVSAAAQDAPVWADVAAILNDRCVMCHSGDYAPLSLQLDSLSNALRGSENGPVLIAGEAGASPLVRRIRGEIEPRMPMDGPPWLDDGQIALIAAWVDAGMPEGEAVAVVPEATVVERPDGEVWFSDVEPIILQRCVKCHSEGSLLGAPPEGLRLSDLSLILAGGESIVVVPGNPGLSLLWRHVAGLEEPRMPFDGPPWLDDDQIALIAEWIAQGARDANGVPSVAQPGELRVEGILTAEDEIDGGAFVVTGGTRVEDGFAVGGRYELRAEVGPDGSVIATRLRER